MPTTPNHTINIVDDNVNWLAWGNLVMKWVNKTQAVPRNVGDLKGQMDARDIKYVIKSDNKRGVTFITYDPTKNVTIVLPDKSMVKADSDYLKSLTNNPTNSAPYPLQSFYSACFAGAPQAQFRQSELLDMEARRIGEYVINECM